MNVEFTGRHMTVSKKLQAQAEAGLARIGKLAGRSASAHVILTEDKYRQIAEVTVVTRGHSMVSSCEASEMTSALHDALAKVEQQAVRHKKKSNTLARHPKKAVKGVGVAEEVAEPVESGAVASARTGLKKAAKKSRGGSRSVAEVKSFGGASEMGEPHVVRSTDSVAKQPMSLEEAVKELEHRDLEVLVFRDSSGAAMVLHCRRDGKLELIAVPAA